MVPLGTLKGGRWGSIHLFIALTCTGSHFPVVPIGRAQHERLLGSRVGQGTPRGGFWNRGSPNVHLGGIIPQNQTEDRWGFAFEELGPLDWEKHFIPGDQQVRVAAGLGIALFLAGEGERGPVQGGIRTPTIRNPRGDS